MKSCPTTSSAASQAFLLPFSEIRLNVYIPELTYNSKRLNLHAHLNLHAILRWMKHSFGGVVQESTPLGVDVIGGEERVCHRAQRPPPPPSGSPLQIGRAHV